MNEFTYVQNLIGKSTHTPQDLGRKPSATLNLLARYYREIGKNNDEIKQLLDEFLSDCLKKDYDANKWIDSIEYQVLKSKKYDLKKVDKVEITEKEMNVINQLKNKSNRKVLFTMLVVSKYYNAVSENNNGWVNLEYKQIFRLANVALKTQNQALLINELYKNGLITVSRKVGKPNIKVNFIEGGENISQNVLVINRLWNLGKEYLLYCGEDFIKCEKCGDIIKNYRNHNKYCKKCSKYQSMGIKILTCCDCGKTFEAVSLANHKKRCDVCQDKYIKEYDKHRKRNP